MKTAYRPGCPGGMGGRSDRGLLLLRQPPDQCNFGKVQNQRPIYPEKCMEKCNPMLIFSVTAYYPIYLLMFLQKRELPEATIFDTDFSDLSDAK